MSVEYYSSPEERKSLIRNYHALGKSLIHDDFINSDNKKTNGKSGKLTFITVLTVDTVKHDRLKFLNAKLSDNTISFEDLKELLRLQR